MATDVPSGEVSISRTPGVGAEVVDPVGNSPAQLHSPTVIRRKGVPKVGATANIKRSVSTPNVRSLAEMEASSMSLAEKRRNKLGYHRTSIACSHCRRRKIRCLVDEKDPHGRCQNCIRLKKECNFFPVDQQPPVERRPRSDSKAEVSSNEELSSTASSTRVATTVAPHDKFPQPQKQQPHLVAPIPESGWTAPYGPLTASPAGRGHMLSRNFSDFSKPFDGPSPWDSPTYLTQSPLSINSSKARADDVANYWRIGDSPGQHHYIQSQSPMPPTPMSSSSYSQAGSLPFATSSSIQEDGMWAPADSHLSLRSMSMVGPEEMPSNAHHYQYANFPSAEFKRRPTNASDVQLAPSLHHSGDSSTASTTESQAPPSLTSFHTSNYPPQSEYQSWSLYPDPQPVSGSTAEDFGSWMPGSSQGLDQESGFQFSQPQIHFSRPP